MSSVQFAPSKTIPPVEENDPAEELDEAIPPKPSVPLTCTIKEAAEITGLSYGFLLAASKYQNRELKLPGFRTGHKHYRVVVDLLPAWLERLNLADL